MGTITVTIGRYERNKVSPIVDIARKIVDILEVSINHLTGEEDVKINQNTSKRILEVSKFEEKDRNHIFSVIFLLLLK